MNTSTKHTDKTMYQKVSVKDELPKQREYYDTNHGAKYFDGNSFITLDDKLVITHWYKSCAKSSSNGEYSRFDLERAFSAGWDKIDFEDWFKDYKPSDPAKSIKSVKNVGYKELLKWIDKKIKNPKSIRPGIVIYTLESVKKKIISISSKDKSKSDAKPMSIQECKDAVAKKYKYYNWIELLQNQFEEDHQEGSSFIDTPMIEKYENEVIILYSQQFKQL